ncbi:MAG: ABC transporter substrate-binding protein, partial [Rhizobium oryzihabitans]
LNVGGLMNVQYAIKDGTIYVLEVNPRASRTVPFVAKTIGAPIAKIAARVMAGEKLEPAIAAYGQKPDPRNLKHIAVKEAVFPFARFPGVDILLGPEMRSTGEVIGLDTDFALAFAKSQLGAGVDLPRSGTVFVSVRDDDKEGVLPAIRILVESGFKVLATGGTQRFLAEKGINAEKINKGETPVDQLGVKAVDDKTLEITLERPTPFFVELLAHQAALPISKASYEKNGTDFVKPGVMVSNGAYKLEAHVPNDSLTVVKNTSFWDASNTKIDKVIFYPIDDQAASVRRFEAKEMDLAYNFSADQIDRLRKSYGEQVHVSPTLATYYYTFDTREAPYDDVRVRQALSMAVDRDFLAKEIYSGSQVPAYSMVPPGMDSYGEPAKADFATLSQLDREDEALKLMKEAGYGEGGKP